MLDISRTDEDFVFVVGRDRNPDWRDYLRIEKIPWWRGGGTRHIFVPRLHEATFLPYPEANNMCEMHNDFRFDRNLPESKVLTLEIVN